LTQVAIPATPVAPVLPLRCTLVSIPAMDFLQRNCHVKKHYILIDFENVQPRALPVLGAHDVKIYVFVGASQARLPFELVDALQALGDKVSYVKASGHGPNALDFHIAFYVGQLAAADPGACFHIVSRDTGFDPLIRHLNDRNIAAQRENTLDDIPFLQNTSAATLDEKIQTILKNLAPRGPSKPRKLKTLTSTIVSLFQNRLAEGEAQKIIAQMQKRKLIVVEGDKITYTLPGTSEHQHK